MLCDISDLIFYIGHHEHLTGIQRVQASIVEVFVAQGDVRFMAFDSSSKKFNLIDADVLRSLLADLTAPLQNRTFVYDRAEARSGRLPLSKPLSASSIPTNACILLLGAAWVIEDYFRYINLLKSESGARFACLVHDLIPVYARETCDQGTAKVFRSFISTSRLSTDLYICVSNNTKKDLLRYFRENGWSEPQTSVVTHATVLSKTPMPRRPEWFHDDPAGFVLVVSTIEGRKNHDLLLRVWDRLVRENPEATPKLICIGRPGWRAADFLIRFVATKGLNGKVEIQSDVADQELEFLYNQCLFTVYPSFYEGWGLPISESLCYGKLCICSNSSSMPEAGGDLVEYINPHDFDGAFDTISNFVNDRTLIAAAEEKIERRFRSRPWVDVANEYIEAVRLSPEQPSRLPTIPGHFVFRTPECQLDGLLGEQLFEAVINHLCSNLSSEPLDLASFEKGHLARGTGDWHYLEPWGCWIGIDGASIQFRADDQKEYSVYISFVVVAPFANDRVKIVANGVTSFHSTNSSIIAFSFLAKKGKNVIKIGMASVSPEQRDASFSIDKRGLSIGVKEMVCISKDDVLRRLDLLQVIARA